MSMTKTIANRLSPNLIVEDYTAKDAIRETLKVLHRDYHDEIQKELKEVILTLKDWASSGQPEGLIRIANIPVATAVILHLEERGFTVSEKTYAPTVYEGWKYSFKVSW